MMEIIIELRWKRNHVLFVFVYVIMFCLVLIVRHLMNRGKQKLLPACTFHVEAHLGSKTVLSGWLLSWVVKFDVCHSVPRCPPALPCRTWREGVLHLSLRLARRPSLQRCLLPPSRRIITCVHQQWYLLEGRTLLKSCLLSIVRWW